MIWVGFYVKGKDILVHISEFNVIYIGEETLESRESTSRVAFHGPRMTW
jgi:hypothetical protein